MGFVANLGKGFIRSAVNQVGKDGGKVISNKIYKGKHATPIYVTKNRDNDATMSDSISIDWSLQPKIKSGSAFGVFLKGILIQIIPFGTIAVLIQGIIYLNKETIPIYTSAPNKISDRRYNVGYRIECYSRVKSGEIRMLTEDEINGIRKRGAYYIFSIVLFFVLLGIAYSATLRFG